MLKITLTFELEEDEIKEIFESYDIKFTKKKLAELKRSIKDQDIDLAYQVEDDVRSALGDAINDLFGE